MKDVKNYNTYFNNKEEKQRKQLTSKITQQARSKIKQYNIIATSSPSNLKENMGLIKSTCKDGKWVCYSHLCRKGKKV